MRGIPGALVAQGGTPITWIVDLISAGVHEAGESAPSSRAPSPAWRADKLSHL